MLALLLLSLALASPARADVIDGSRCSVVQGNANAQGFTFGLRCERPSAGSMRATRVTRFSVRLTQGTSQVDLTGARVPSYSCETNDGWLSCTSRKPLRRVHGTLLVAHGGAAACRPSRTGLRLQLSFTSIGSATGALPGATSRACPALGVSASPRSVRVGKRTCVAVRVHGYGGPGVSRAVATLLGARRVIHQNRKARLCVRFARRGNFPLVVRAKGYPKGEAQITVTATGRRRLGSQPGPLQLNGSYWSATVDYSDAGSMTLQSNQMDKFGHWDSLPTTVSDGTPATLSMHSNHIAYGPEGTANYTTPNGSWQLQLGNPYSDPTYAGCAFAGAASNGPEFCSVQGQLVNDGGNYTVAQTITVGENPPTIAVGQQCGASMSAGDTLNCTAAGQISPVNSDVSKIISGWEYTNQTVFKNVGAQKVKVGVPAATHGYIYESIDPGETETVGAGASGDVVLEYDGPPGTSDWCGVQVVNVQILED